MGRQFGADVLQAVSELANWVGLGSLVDAAVEDASLMSGSTIITSSSVNNMINQIVDKAKRDGTQKMEQLNARLENLLSTMPKSNKYRDALQSAISKTRKQLSNANDIINQAEDRLTNAKTQALNVDSMPRTQKMSWGGQASEAERIAKNEANAALEKYKELEKL